MTNYIEIRISVIASINVNILNRDRIYYLHIIYIYYCILLPSLIIHYKVWNIYENRYGIIPPHLIL